MMKRVFTLLLLCAALLVSAQALAANVEVLPVSDWAKIVSLDIKDQPLVDVLEMLFKDTDISCKVSPEISALKVTAVLKNVSRHDAFMEILKGAGASASSNESIWYVMPGPMRPPANNLTSELERKLVDLTAQLAVALRRKTEQSPEVQDLKAQIEVLEERLAAERKLIDQQFAAQEAYSRTMAEGGLAQESLTQVFTIQYVNPAELPPLIYALGAQQVSVVTGGKLVVRATEPILSEANDVIASVDREESLPRPVRLKLTVNVRSEQKGGEPFDCSISCDGAGAEGQMVSPNLSVKLPVGKTGDTAEVFLTSWITPTITPDGKIALRGSGSFKFTPSGEVLRTFEVAAVVQPGKSQVISEGSADVGTGKVSFSVDIVATIGEGRLRIGGGIGGGQDAATPRRW